MNSIAQARVTAASLAGAEPTDEERAAAAAMLQLIGGLQISRALYAVAELGIADGLAGGPMNSAQLARATGTHEPSLYRVLRLLASVGVLRETEPRTFSLTVLGDRLRTGVPASVLRGILFDLPEVAGGAAGVLEAAGVADRCEIVTGDFFESVPAGADACVMANVLHDWDDAQSVGILARCRQAMDGGGRVLIVERLIPQDPAAAVPVLVSDLNMLVVTGGKERTNAAYGELLAAAGLSQGRILPVGSPYGIIEGLVP
jgi:hypothetical protein